MGNCVSNHLCRLEDFQILVPSNIKHKPTPPIHEPIDSTRELDHDHHSEIQIENGNKTQDEEESDFLISDKRKKEFHEMDSEVLFDKKRRKEKDPVIKRVNNINFEP